MNKMEKREIYKLLKKVQGYLIIPSRNLSQEKIDGINETLMFIESEVKKFRKKELNE